MKNMARKRKNEVTELNDVEHLLKNDNGVLYPSERDMYDELNQLDAFNYELRYSE